MDRYSRLKHQITMAQIDLDSAVFYVKHYKNNLASALSTFKDYVDIAKGAAGPDRIRNLRDSKKELEDAKKKLKGAKARLKIEKSKVNKLKKQIKKIAESN